MENNRSPIGSSFDDFLIEENIYEEVTAAVLKRIFMEEFEEIMKKEKIKKKVIRDALNSPSMVSRMFSENTKVQFETLVKAGLSVGYAPVLKWVPTNKVLKKINS